MAKRTRVVMIDDLTGEEVGEGGQTLTFSVSGVDYSIDLSAENVGRFEAALQPYINVAERVGGRKAAADRTVCPHLGEWIPGLCGHGQPATAWRFPLGDVSRLDCSLNIGRRATRTRRECRWAVGVFLRPPS